MKMTLRVFVRAFAFPLMACIFTGCEVFFLNPLSTPQDATLDNRLMGEWVSTDGKKTGDHIRFDQGPNMEMHISVFGDDITEQNPAFTMFTTKLGKHYYMNLSPTDEYKGKGYLIVRYTVSGDELKVWILDDAKVKSAITHGKIKGQPGRVLGPTTVSDSTEKIVALIEASGGNDLFVPFVRFERIKQK
jgi:hypothetical protein